MATKTKLKNALRKEIKGELENQKEEQINNEEMKCQGANIDLIKGKINNHDNLRRIVFIRDGKVFREKKFSNKDGFTLQMVVLGNRIIEVQLIKEAVFSSNYNQMFMLGRFRKDLFDEINNSYPFSSFYLFLIL